MDGAGIAAVLRSARRPRRSARLHSLPGKRRPEAHKRACSRHAEDDTRSPRNSRAGSARGLANRFLREAEAKHFPQLAFPAQNSSHREAAPGLGEGGQPDFSPCGPGRRARLPARLPAAELIARSSRQETMPRSARARPSSRSSHAIRSDRHRPPRRTPMGAFQGELKGFAAPGARRRGDPRRVERAKIKPEECRK
jgi:hypothetical protein